MPSPFSFLLEQILCCICLACGRGGCHVGGRILGDVDYEDFVAINKDIWIDNKLILTRGLATAIFVTSCIESEVVFGTSCLCHDSIVAIHFTVANCITTKPMDVLATGAHCDKRERTGHSLTAALQRHWLRGPTMSSDPVTLEAWEARVTLGQILVASLAVAAHASVANTAEPIQCEAFGT